MKIKNEIKQGKKKRERESKWYDKNVKFNLYKRIFDSHYL